MRKKERKEFDVSDIESQNGKTIRRKEKQKRKEEKGKEKEAMELQIPNRVQNIQNLLGPHEQTTILRSRHIRNRRRPTPYPLLPLNTQRIALALRAFIMITTIVIIIMMVVVMAPLAREARR